MTKRNKNDNLIPIETLTSEEAKKRGAAGGRKSAATRRRKADVRKTVTDILNNSYTVKDKETGTVSSITGIQAIITNLFKMATDPKNRNCVQSIKLILELYGAYENKAEQRLLDAQIQLMEAKAKSMSAMEELNVEDLAPLAKLLRMQDNKTFGDLPAHEVKDVTPDEENAGN